MNSVTDEIRLLQRDARAGGRQGGGTAAALPNACGELGCSPGRPSAAGGGRSAPAGSPRVRRGGVRRSLRGSRVSKRFGNSPYLFEIGVARLVGVLPLLGVFSRGSITCRWSFYGCTGLLGSKSLLRG